MTLVDDAITHLRSKGCSARTGTYSVHLPWLREELNTLFGFTSDMDKELWVLIRQQVEIEFPGYVLANDTTTNNGGWTRDWFFTNDPEKITGHNEADLKSTATRLTNSLRRAVGAQSSPYLAGAYGAAVQILQALARELLRQAPQMLRDVDAGVIRPTSGHGAAREVKKRIEDIVDDSYELFGEQVYAYAQSRGTAATSTPTPAPTKRSASGTP